MDPADVRIALRIYGPAGAIYLSPGYTNPAISPDINGSVSLTNNSIPFPVDTDGDPLVGTYLFEIAYLEIGESIVNTTTSWDYNFDVPTLALNVEANCEASSLQVALAPNVPLSGVTTEAISTTVNYPPAAGDEDPEGVSLPVTFTTLSRTLAPLAQGTYTIVSATTYSYRMGTDPGPNKSEYYVRFQQSATKKFEANCASLCRFYCQIKALYDDFGAACASKRQARQVELLDKFLRATALFDMLRQAVACGKSSDRVLWEQRLTELLGACDCCEDNDAVWVTSYLGSTGAGPGGQYTFLAGSGLKVSVVNGTVTYSLSDSFLASITDLFTSIGTASVTGLVECDGSTPISGTLATLLQRIFNQILPRTGTTCPVTGTIVMSDATGFKTAGDEITFAFSTTEKKLRISLDSDYVFQLIGTLRLDGDLQTTEEVRDVSFTAGGVAAKTLIYQLNATSGNLNVQLYSTSGGNPPIPQLLYFKRIDTTSNVVTLIPDAGMTIDGAASYTLDPGESVRIKWRNDSTDFRIYSSHLPKALAMAGALPGAWRVIGTPGEPGFAGSAANATPTLGRPTVAYRKFQDYLELRGVVNPNGSVLLDGGNMLLFTITDTDYHPPFNYEIPVGLSLDPAGTRLLKLVVSTNGAVLLEASGGNFPYVLPVVFLNNIRIPLT